MKTQLLDESEQVAHVTTNGRCYSIPLEVARELGSLRAINAELLAALQAIHAGFMDGSIKWAKPRQADSDPYHPANTLMTAAIAKATQS